MKNPAKIIIVASFLGFLNALTLFILFLQATFSKVPVPGLCKINEVISCSGSLTSPISQILGLPAGSIAIFVYPLLAGLAYWALISRRPQKQYFAIAVLSAMGLSMTIVTNYNEYHFLHSVCLICLTCIIFITTILVASIKGFTNNEANQNTPRQIQAPVKKTTARKKRR